MLTADLPLLLQSPSIGVYLGARAQHSDISGVAGDDRFQNGFIQTMGGDDDGTFPVDWKILHRLLDRFAHMECPGIGKSFLCRILRPGFDHLDPESASRPEAGDLFIHMSAAKQEQASFARDHVDEKFKRSAAGMTVCDGKRNIHMGAFSFRYRSDRSFDHGKLGDSPTYCSDRAAIFLDDHVGVAARRGADAFRDRHERKGDVPIPQSCGAFKYVHNPPRQVPARTAVILF